MKHSKFMLVETVEKLQWRHIFWRREFAHHLTRNHYPRWFFPPWFRRLTLDPRQSVTDNFQAKHGKAATLMKRMLTLKLPKHYWKYKIACHLTASLECSVVCFSVGPNFIQLWNLWRHGHPISSLSCIESCRNIVTDYRPKMWYLTHDISSVLKSVLSAQLSWVYQFYNATLALPTLKGFQI